jgi:hypothetical protein
MRGVLRCAQNDDVKLTTARATARTTATTRTKATATATARTRATATKATAKTKYRDLSTAAEKCAAFGEMMFVMGLKENKQPQEQEQRQEQELAG